MARTATSLESGVALELRCGSGYLRLPAIGRGCGCGDPRLGLPNIGRLLANRSRGVSASARRFDRSPRRGLCRTVAIRRLRSRNMLVNSCIGANRVLLMQPGAYLAPIVRLINGRRIVRSIFTVSGCPAGPLGYRFVAAKCRLRPGRRSSHGGQSG